MDLFDLYASLTLDTDGYETGMKNAKTATTNAGDAASSAANGGFTVMKEVLANLATSVITELISKCKELVTSVYEIGTETETSFAQLETIAGADSIDELTESLYDLSVQTGISSSDLALTAYNAISAGSSAEEAAEMVETAAKLATAGFTDTDSALSVLSTTINAYGMSAEDAATISDSLIQVQNLGVTTVAELSSAMGKAISTASAYSIDLYNLEAAYISTTKAGISTEESTTYLSSMFNELGDSGSDVAAILSEETDMTFGQLMDSGYNLADVLNILYESVDGDSEALMNLWGSAEAGKAASAIISQGLDTFADSLDAVSNAAGSTEEAYETMTDTLEWKVEQLQTIGETMMLKLYEGAESQLSSVVTWASEAGQDILDAYEEGGLSGAFDKAASIVSSLFTGFAASVSENLPSIIEQGFQTLLGFSEGFASGVSNTLETVTAVISAVLSQLITHLPEFIDTGVQMITNLLSGFTGEDTLLQANVLKIVEKISELITTGLPLLVSKGADMVSNILSGITASLPNVLSSAVEVVNNIINGIIGAIPSLADSAVQIVSSFVSFLLENLPQVLSAGADIVVNLIQGIASVLPDLVSSAIELVTNIASSIIQNLPEILAAGMSIVLELINGLVQTLPDLLMTAVSLITSMLASIGELLPELLAMGVELVLNLISGIVQLVPDIITAAGDLITGFIDAFTETDWLSVGADIVSGVANGITNAFSTIVDAATNLGETILSTVQGFFGISSPSKVMAEQGDYLVQGLIGGLESMPDDVESILADVDVLVNDWADGLYEDIAGWMTTVLEAVLEWLTILHEETITVWLTTLHEEITLWLTTLQEEITGWLTTLYEALALWMTTSHDETILLMETSQEELTIWLEEIYELLCLVMTNVQEMFESGLEVIMDLLEDRLSKITEKVDQWGNETKSQFYTIGQNVMEGLINGIDSKISALYDKIKTSLSGLVSQAEAELGIASPSKVFAAIGGYMAEGLGEGWNDEIEDVIKTIASDLDFGISSIDTDASAIGTALGSSGRNGSMRGGVSVVQNIYSQAQTAADLLREARWQQERAVLRGV